MVANVPEERAEAEVCRREDAEGRVVLPTKVEDFAVRSLGVWVAAKGCHRCRWRRWQLWWRWDGVGVHLDQIERAPAPR
eukprot:4169597-Prymnesium_polylepis.1